VAVVPVSPSICVKVVPYSLFITFGLASSTGLSALFPPCKIVADLIFPESSVNLRSTSISSFAYT